MPSDFVVRRSVCTVTLRKLPCFQTSSQPDRPTVQKEHHLAAGLPELSAPEQPPQGASVIRLFLLLLLLLLLRLWLVRPDPGGDAIRQNGDGLFR